MSEADAYRTSHRRARPRHDHPALVRTPHSGRVPMIARGARARRRAELSIRLYLMRETREAR